MKENVRLFMAAIQLVLFITAVVMLAQNQHESFQDFMIFTMVVGYLGGFHRRQE